MPTLSVAREHSRVNPELLGAEVAKEMRDDTASLRTERESFQSWVKEKGGFAGLKGSDLEEFHNRDKKINEITEAFEKKREGVIIEVKNRLALDAMNAPVGAVPFSVGGKEGEIMQAFKSLGERVAEHKGLRGFNSSTGQGVQIDFNDIGLKDVITTSNGFAPANNRTDKVVLSAQRRPVVADLIPQDTTTNNLVKYMEETMFDNQAAAVDEGATKPESKIRFTEQDGFVRKIATWFAVSDEQLDDVSQIRQLIDNRGSLMILLAEEVELLNGNGTAPHLQGFMTKNGVGTYARATIDDELEPTADAILKSYDKIRTIGEAEPTGTIFHPTDWTQVRLQKTKDGVYIWGSPSEAGPDRIWGKPVVATKAMAQGSALSGDFQLYSHISRRMGITVLIGYKNDDLIRNQKTIVIEERLSLEIYRPAAFCKTTGLGA